MLLRSLILRVADRPWIERFIKNSWVTRGVVKRFIAGDSLEEAMAATDALAQKGFRVTLDLLGEHTKTEADANAAAGEYVEMLERIARSPHSGGSPERINISIKLTQLGLLADTDRALERLEVLLSKAGENNNFVRIDMEDSDCTDRTLSVAAAAFKKRPNVGVALQSMLFRTGRDIEALIQLGMRVRLVKGAYLEPANVAHQRRDEVDAAYIACSYRLLAGGNFPAFGTHDGKIIERLSAYAKQHAIGQERYEFQFLYGIRRDLQEGLRKEGYGVRVYVPYGSSWYPYFTRRLAERPANLLFFLRSMFSK
ncbi:MAG: proline dehydrogenase family protein [Fimbriimonadales bacterium]